jgi:DivIVA domain-containing protein
VNADPEPLTARIRNARFRTTRWGGYDEREVDNFLDDAVQALRRGQPADPPPRFSTVRLRPSYNKQDVDALVSEIWPER